MSGRANILRQAFVSREAAPDLAKETERHLADSPTLAFRVAYSVLRQREDAEDVAQDGLVRAFRRLEVDVTLHTVK